MDYLTKWPEARALSEATGKEVSNFIFEDIICRHGSPQKILTDRGTHFKNQIVEGLMEKFKVNHLFSTPYHLKTNGLVEGFNKTLCESLAKLGGSKNWDRNISSVLFAYRNRLQDSSKMKPFYLVYGRKAKIWVEEEDDREITMIERLEHIMEKLPEERYRAKM